MRQEEEYPRIGGSHEHDLREMRRSLTREAKIGGAWTGDGIQGALGRADPAPSRVGGGEPSPRSSTASFEERYPPLLDHAYCVGLRFFGGDHDLAQEVAQETLTRAYGASVSDEAIAGLSPARFEAINPYGTMTFDIAAVLKRTRRPLRLR